ncbi:MAG: hypothetical protein PVF74_08615, partial [Anaerolineales bacterium]
MHIPNVCPILNRCATVLALLLLVACSSNKVTPQKAVATQQQVEVPKQRATSTQPQEAATKEGPPTTLSPTTTPIAQVSQEPSPFPLTESGPYLSGKRTYQLLDASRGNRPVNITVWYPALRPPGSSSSFPKLGADPDLSGAPYPLILSSTKVARIFTPYLISHGFTWVSVDRIDTYYRMNEQMYQQPLDLLFALDQVASHPPDGLEGMIDTEQAGAIGYSFD